MGLKIFYCRQTLPYIPIILSWDKIVSVSILDITCSIHSILFALFIFIPRHSKSGGVLCYTLRTVWASDCAWALCFRALSLVFWPMFFKLCLGITIGEEWDGIVSGLISFRNNRVMAAIDVCKNVFSPNIFKINWWISIQDCIFIDIYKI